MRIARPRVTRCTVKSLRRASLMAALLFIMPLAGCVTRGYLPADTLTYRKLSIPYQKTQLKTSTTLRVLEIAREPAYQFDPDKVQEALLTQSDTAIAFSGRSADEFKTWLNLIVFDEYRLTATRKYFFLVDERMEVALSGRGGPLIPPRKGLAFDAEFVIPPEILTTPYATEEAQKIAAIRWLAGQFDRDVAGLLGDPAKAARGSAVISVAAMMMNQTFSGLLTELNDSPGLARNISADRGIEFPHINLDKGRVRLRAQGGLATVTVRVNLPVSSMDVPRMHSAPPTRP
jgi:hypothetical protein